MKKIHITMSLILLSSQLVFPITSFAEERSTTDIELNQHDSSSSSKESEESISESSDVKNDLNQDDDFSLGRETVGSSQIESSKDEEVSSIENNSMDSWMPDKNLQEIVSEILGKDTFTQEDMLSITNASVDNKVISNVQGLSYAKNLSSLYVTNTDLSATSNLSEVGTLQNLTTLVATGDNLSDISFIKSNELNSLEYVDISKNLLTDLNSISGITLPNLKMLDVSDNLINDISILESATVPNLYYLKATNNQISDISPIANSTITSLKVLDVSHNFIKDIDSFANSTFINLEELSISDNQIHDISIMKNLKNRYPNLHVFNTDNNYISNIDFMEGYNLSSSTSARNQIYEDTISLIKPSNNGKTQIEIPVPITSLDYQYDSSSGYYFGVPDLSSENLTLSNITGVSNLKLTDGTLLNIENNFNPNKVQNFIIDGSTATLPSQITFDWSGAQGQFTGDATININWLDIQNPVIDAEDQILYVGDSFDALDSVKAYDKQLDGSPQTDLTDQVKVVENTVNTSKAGLYSVKYSITNSYNLTTEKLITVQVKENKQSIHGSDFSMYVGDKEATLADFNPSATDKDGNVIEVTADLSSINFSKSGTYNVVLAASDGQTKTVKLTIKQNKQSISGSDFSMYVGDKEATLTDFNPSATDKDGNVIEVTANLSNIDFSKSGTYDIVLTASDGQTKTVKLTIKEKVVVPEKNKGTGYTSIPKGNSLPTTGETTNKKSSLPSTGEATKPILIVVGTMILLVTGTYVFTIKRKKSN